MYVLCRWIPPTFAEAQAGFVTLLKDDGSVHPFSSVPAAPSGLPEGAGEAAQGEETSAADAAPPMMERTLSGLRCEGNIQTWCLRLNEFSSTEVRLLCAMAWPLSFSLIHSLSYLRLLSVYLFRSTNIFASARVI